MTDRSDRIVSAFAGALVAQQITLAVGDQVRMAQPKTATWKTITSLSEHFVCLDGTEPTSRRSLEKMIAGDRIEWRVAQ